MYIFSQRDISVYMIDIWHYKCFLIKLGNVFYKDLDLKGQWSIDLCIKSVFSSAAPYTQSTQFAHQLPQKIPSQLLKNIYISFCISITINIYMYINQKSKH